MPFQDPPKNAYSSNKRAVAYACHMALKKKGKILSLLCSMTDSHVAPRLHNEAGRWKCTDVVVSQRLAEKPAAWIVLQCVFVCVGVCRRQRKSESSSQDSLLFSMCHGICCWDGGSNEVCGQVFSSKLQEANLCDNLCLCLPFSYLIKYFTGCSAWCNWDL